jgi:hypothetical protein
MKLDWKRLEPLVTGALDDFNEFDRILLKEQVQERAITHKLAEYIRERLEKVKGYGRGPEQPLVVDCEYNRLGHGVQVKKTPCRDEELWDDGSTYYTPNPDIVVHHRTTQHLNNMAVEVKTYYNDYTVSILADKLKLVGYLYYPTEYDYGLFLDLGLRRGAIVLKEAKLVEHANVSFEHGSPQAKQWDYCLELMTVVTDRHRRRRRILRPDEVNEKEATRLMMAFEAAFSFRDLLAEWKR